MKIRLTQVVVLILLNYPIKGFSQFIVPDGYGGIGVTQQVFPPCYDCLSIEGVRFTMNEHQMLHSGAKEDVIYGEPGYTARGDYYPWGSVSCQALWNMGHVLMTMENSQMFFPTVTNPYTARFSKLAITNAVKDYYKRLRIPWYQVEVDTKNWGEVRYSYQNQGELIPGKSSNPSIAAATVTLKDGVVEGYEGVSITANSMTSQGWELTVIAMGTDSFALETVDTYNINMMVRSFLADCVVHGIYREFNDVIDVEFVELGNGLLGLAFGKDDDSRIELRISPSAWSQASEPTRWYLVYHELGHDVLNLRHGEAGRMMFNYANRMYTWQEFREDKEAMFIHAKRKYDAGTLWE